jgi:hypothetical protein
VEVTLNEENALLWGGWRRPMTHEPESASWWELHLRKARGEALSKAEQQVYDAELARQDQAAPLPLASLKKLREQAGVLETENAALRQRLHELEREIRAVERALSRQTREALGVPE